MSTRGCRTRTTTASAITESTSPWTMVEPVRSGGQPRTNGWGSSTSRACASKLSMADSPGNRSTTTAASTSSWPVGKRSAWPSRQRQGTFPHTAATRGTVHLIPPASRTLVIFANRKNGRVALQRMDNVGIVVESLDAAISFFAELGLELEGRAMIEGDWSGRVTGLRDQRVEIAMMRTPDGHGRIELSRFLAPPVVADHRNAPVNALGYLRIMFAVEDVDDTLARLRPHGAELVGEVVQYEDMYRLCYVRGPEGILIA